MKSKRWLSVSMVFALIVALSTTAFAAPAPKPIINRVPDLYEATELTAINKVADLMAGQNTDVGDLYINSLGGNVYLVTYQLTAENYFLGEIHFEAISDGESGFTSDSDIIYSKGGIIPGKLTVNLAFDMPDVNEVSGTISGGTRQYSFIYTSGAPVDSFAAHSVVCLATAEAYEDIIVGSKDETGYIASAAIEDQVVEVREPYGYPDPAVDYTSVWDTAFSASPDWASKLIDSGAQFVWNSELSSGLTGTPIPTSNDLTVRGDVCRIDLDVDVPSDATGISATLYIVADNGYIAKIGDSIINSAGFNAEAYAALSDSTTDDLLDGDALLLDIFPNLTAFDTKQLFVESVVSSSAWQSMIAVGSNVPLVAGVKNTINIAAMNEQMDGGTDYNNPAGVIYFIEYKWTVPTYTTVTRYRLATDCETAWGMGQDADGSNWSQIITNVPVCPDPVLLNGGFEAPILTSSWAIYPTGTEGLGWIVGWAAGGNYALELQSSSTVGLAPDEGNQYAELDGNNSVSIFQDINTCPLRKYTVSFAWSPRAGSGMDAVEVFWNGVSQGVFTGADVQGWNDVTLENLTPATDFNTRLEFKEVGSSNTYGMFLDDVTIDFYTAP